MWSWPCRAASTAPGWAPGQMDTRLAFNRSPTMLHNYGEDANATQ
jgi:hypothetical protein